MPEIRGKWDLSLTGGVLSVNCSRESLAGVGFCLRFVLKLHLDSLDIYMITTRREQVFGTLVVGNSAVPFVSLGLFFC